MGKRRCGGGGRDISAWRSGVGARFRFPLTSPNTRVNTRSTPRMLFVLYVCRVFYRRVNTRSTPRMLFVLYVCRVLHRRMLATVRMHVIFLRLLPLSRSCTHAIIITPKTSFEQKKSWKYNPANNPAASLDKRSLS